MPKKIELWCQCCDLVLVDGISNGRMVAINGHVLRPSEKGKEITVEWPQVLFAVCDSCLKTDWLEAFLIDPGTLIDA